MSKTLLFLLLPFAAITLAYSQIVENPSFEDWETENGKAEPVNWSSVQTAIPQNLANLAPQVMKKSEDAHTGDFSVRLENLSTFGIVATGTITNGRLFADFDKTKGYGFSDPTDPRWNTPIAGRPDSIIGWYKFTPPASGKDFPTVKALLHTGQAKMPDPDSTNYIGYSYGELPSTAQSEWKRFSFPIHYRTDDQPEYVLILLTSGNGTDAVAGSIALYDDIALVFNPTSVEDEKLNELIGVQGLNGAIRINMFKIAMGHSFDLKVFDLLGQQVYAAEMQSGNLLTVDNLRPGAYFCVFSNDKGRTIFKKVLVR